MSKTLCEFDKNDLKKYEKKFKKSLKQPRYICKNCYRAAIEKDYLCKPKKLSM